MLDGLVHLLILDHDLEEENIMIRKMKNNKYHMVKTVLKSNCKFVDTHIHDHSLSWLGTGTSIKTGGVKLVCLECGRSWVRALIGSNQ